MRYLATVAICSVYFAGVLATVPMAGPMAWAFIAAWSAGFVWCYLAYLRGRALVAIAIVVVVTIVLPVAALVVMAWPRHELLWPAFQDRGARRGLEFFAPLVAALFVMVVRRLSSTVAHE